MSRQLFAFKVWQILSQKHRPSKQGFTLTEVLISAVIGSLVISVILFLVVEMAQLARREEALNQTQLDMKRALDYINRDVREAVFVYSTPFAQIREDASSVPIELVNQITDPPADAEPILAFWRSDPVDIGQLNNDCNQYGTQEQECEVLKIRQTAYTLVVYYQTINGDDEIWGGRSRIIRYELPKYSTISTSQLIQSEGYQDPVSSDSSFENWIRNGDVTRGNKAVLVDFVDSPDSNTVDVPDCSGFGPDMVRTPEEEADWNSFYTCVRTNQIGTGDTASFTNQDLVVFLRGNAVDDNAIGFGGVSNRSLLPTLQSQVLIRGVLDEQVQ
jgi:prepilin-type N-terminal cleavage/methylation domain-containing protein